jgi:hypothetical protein
MAKLLGLTRSAMSTHRTGKVKSFGEETALRIAELLDLNPAYVLACLAAERAKRPDVAKVWKKVAGGFMALMLAVLSLGQPQPAQASQTADNMYYAKTRHRRRRAWLLGALLGLCGLSAQAADPWSAQDKGREAVYLTTWALDWGQTRDIENHPGLYETNRFLGEHPSRGDINRYFLGGAVLHLVMVHYLPARYRPAFQYLTIGMQVGTLDNNYRLGLNLDF